MARTSTSAPRFLPPTSQLVADDVAAFRAALDRQSCFVAAYFVTEQFPGGAHGPPIDQERVVFEFAGRRPDWDIVHALSAGIPRVFPMVRKVDSSGTVSDGWSYSFPYRPIHVMACCPRRRSASSTRGTEPTARRFRESPSESTRRCHTSAASPSQTTRTRVSASFIAIRLSRRPDVGSAADTEQRSAEHSGHQDLPTGGQHTTAKVITLRGETSRSDRVIHRSLGSGKCDISASVTSGAGAVLLT